MRRLHMDSVEQTTRNYLKVDIEPRTSIFLSLPCSRRVDDGAPIYTLTANIKR